MVASGVNQKVGSQAVAREEIANLDLLDWHKLNWSIIPAF